MERNFVILVVFLLKGLEGHMAEQQQCSDGQLLAMNTEDKIVLSPIIIKARIKSKFENREFTEVNVKVYKVYKSPGGQRDFRLLRLKFNKCLWSNPAKLGGLYIFYLSQDGNTPVAEPDRVGKQIKKLIRNLACRNCASAPTVKTSNDELLRQEVKVGLKLRLHCLFDGKPKPSITWYKDGKIISENSRVKSQTKRRKSVLKIRKMIPEDRGIYACEAKSVLGKAAIDYRVEVIEKKPQVDGWKLCPIDNICMNGGVCRLYPIIGEILCICANGFSGRQCEHKYRPSLHAD